MTRLLLALMVLTTASQASQGTNVAGDWELVQTAFNDDNGGQRTAGCAVRQDGRRLAGKCGNDQLAGDVNDERGVAWQLIVNYDNHTATIFYQGNLDESGTIIRGTWRCPKHCENAAYKKGEFVASKR